LNPHSIRYFCRTRLVAFLLLTPIAAPAQTAATLSGRITGVTGTGIANARVSAKTANGQPAEVFTSEGGLYRMSNLPPGDYEITATADGFTSKTENVTLSAGAQEKLDLSLMANENGPAPPSLGDLGFPNTQTQGSAADQARLDRRSHMLKIHQKLGLITAAPILAAIFSSSLAKPRNGTVSGRELHAALGSAAATMYFTSASFAIFAPKIPGTKPRGPIRLHRILAWIHGPGMVLTPVLGAMAFEQISQGEKVHGIAKAHGIVATTTAIAYGLATIDADLEVQFAGQTAHYKVLFQRSTEGKDVRVTGTIPATLSDFKIDPPSLLAIPIKNEIPVKVDMTWREM
jgi:carboxypeptidase family protein